MAANRARKALLQFSSTSVKTLVTRPATASTATSFTAKAAKLSGLSPSKHRLCFSRFPAELGGALSLMPLHSVTASALFTSLLSLHGSNWGCLSEGFATPL